MSKILREGFWRPNGASENHELPAPVVGTLNISARHQYVSNINRVQDEADAKSPRINIQRELYRGLSRCRCCGAMNGNAEYTVDFGGAIVTWPAGFTHYIEEHGVAPTDEFVDFLNRLPFDYGKLPLPSTLNDTKAVVAKPKPKPRVRPRRAKPLDKTLAFLRFERERWASGPLSQVVEVMKHIEDLDAMIREVGAAQPELRW